MKAKENMKRYAPLADSMRSQKLEEFFGQEKLVGKDSFLRRAIESDSVPSLIFWGPPGSGKTTLASIIANETGSEFIQLSGVASGKRDLMSVVERAKKIKKDGKRTILFIDEIHRWNKAQQDALLPYVENGTVTLIGATTENPSFEVISALISRSRILVLEKLEPRDIEKILRRALEDKVRGLGNEKIKISDNDISILSKLANGDARMALNTLEAAAQLSAEISAKTGQTRMIDSELIKKVLQKSHLYYDKTGEEHYNIISALHKSMRGGDANAALYWLARMLEGGEDPKYVARRLLRFASEDVGLADNFALVLANNVFDACHKIGYPECSVHLAQLAIYLSKAPKSVKAYFAYEKAKKDVEKFGNLPVPMHIRNAPTKLMEKLGYGKGYKYTPLEDSSGQQYLPDELRNRRYI
ncbi:MAG: replication-associated recombination protein A [Patescibacteria group bacterium]|jgi:putative ATPase|nr:replication-associated recombination protein A [Candidatus Moranbacteria bacterium]HQB59573.1 replication-associated recombination protein A [Candidatus Moranbacteria bacterium]